MSAELTPVRFRQALRLVGGRMIYNDPTRCDEIGCPCIFPKQLDESRSGDTLIFYCPSTRISATVGPSTRGQFVFGAHYLGT